MRIYVTPRHGRLLLRILAGWLAFVSAVIVGAMAYTVVTGNIAVNQWLMALLILSTCAVAVGCDPASQGGCADQWLRR